MERFILYCYKLLVYNQFYLLPYILFYSILWNRVKKYIKTYVFFSNKECRVLFIIVIIVIKAKRF